MDSGSRGFKYVLSAIDQCTQWPKAVCLLRMYPLYPLVMPLLQVFSRTGIHKIITIDQGINFTSSLTKEFMKKILSSPRLSVPGHPQSNGFVEKWNGLLKNMMHRMMREKIS